MILGSVSKIRFSFSLGAKSIIVGHTKTRRTKIRRALYVMSQVIRLNRRRLLAASKNGLIQATQKSLVRETRPASVLNFKSNLDPQ